uniref:Uncharacterized protein n=1 Tax=Caenorhabditis brenneri TaxID=135651 RepID=B6VBE9_CAEBE|nr:hypothetical protein Cbre_JD07.009 [Caenorhabditis brenneri]
MDTQLPYTQDADANEESAVEREEEEEIQETGIIGCIEMFDKT